MRKTFFYLPVIILLFISCEESDKIKIAFQDNLEINDLLSQNKYQKLNSDEDYKDYINEVFENSVEMHSIVIKGSEMMAESNLVGDEIGSDMSVDLFFSGLKGAGAMAMEGFTMMGLESDKEELYASFSNPKIALADQFEEKVIDILKASNIAPKNPNVEPTDMLLNYKSYGSEIKNDDRLRDNLSDLTDDVDQLFLLGYKIRIQQNLNIALGNNLDDFSQISTLGLKILNQKGNYPVSISSKLLDKYFESLDDILEEISNIENNLSIPLEDWSENKILNYNFVIEDIKIKLKQDILSFSLDSQPEDEPNEMETDELSSNSELLSEIPPELEEILEKKIAEDDIFGVIEELDKALEIYPNNGELFEIRGLHKMIADDLDGAQRDLEIAKTLLPKNYYGNYYTLAVLNFKQQDWSGAIKNCNTFLSSNPSNIHTKTAAHYTRGSSNGILENYEEAIEDFDIVIDLEGENKEFFVYMWRGRSKYFLGDYEGSIKDYDFEIKRNPGVVLMYTERARSKESMELYDRAIEDYNIAIQLSPEDINLYVKRANAKLNSEKYEESILDCDKALNFDPTNGELYLMRAKGKLALGKIDEACIDLYNAKEYGETEFSDYGIKEYCGTTEVY